MLNSKTASHGRWWKKELEEKEGGFEKFAEGYKIFGFNKTEGWRDRAVGVQGLGFGV